MRSILNISLPESMVELVNAAVASGKYATKSEFIRTLLRDWNDKVLASELAKSRLELAQGKGKVLTSLASLR